MDEEEGADEDVVTSTLPRDVFGYSFIEVFVHSRDHYHVNAQKLQYEDISEEEPLATKSLC